MNRLVYIAGGNYGKRGGDCEEGLYKKIADFVIHSFKKIYNPLVVKKISASSALEIWVVTPSFPVLKGDKGYPGIVKKILRWLDENDMDVVASGGFVSPEILKKEGFRIISGEMLFTALVPAVLRKISKACEKSPGELEIALIAGDNVYLALASLELIAGMCRFVSVITQEKDKTEKVLDSICDEYGLSVRLTSDVKSGIRGVNIIIDFRKANDVCADPLVKPGAVVIKVCGDSEDKRMHSDSVTITSVDVKLNDSSLEKHCGEFHIRKILIAEMELFTEYGLIDIMGGENIGVEALKKLGDAFRGKNYKMGHFIGIHGLVSHEEIRKRIREVKYYIF